MNGKRWLWAWSVGLPAALGCSTEAYYAATGPRFDWDTAGLESPKDDLREAHSQLCAIALACRAIVDEPKLACAVSIADESGVIYDGWAGVERRGRSSASFPKANFGLEFRDESGETERAVEILGMGTESDWILDGMWADRSMMRNALAYDLFASFDERRHAAQGHYCSLVLNGKYHGIYRLLERPKRDQSRIDIPGDDGSGTSFVVTQDPEGTLDFELGLEERWQSISPNHQTATSAQLEGIQAWFDGLAEALRGRGERTIFDYLDRADVVDWILIQEFSKNIDAYKLSVYFYKSPEAPARLVPWDMDLAFGQPLVAASAPEPEDAAESRGWVGQRTAFIRAILGSDGLAGDITARWRVLREGPLTRAAIESRIDGYQAAMAPELDANVARWPLDQVTFAAIYPPYSFPERASYEAEVEALKGWVDERLEWMDENIDAFTQ
jgi:hypothetical protein